MINTLFKDFKLPKKKTIVIDNVVFQLHYKFTTILLIVFTVLVTAKQYVGEPIHCMPETKDVAAKMVDTFCWIHTTFSVNTAWQKPVGSEIDGGEVIYPGVEKTPKGGDDVTYHAYYQWVCFVLFVQAIFFYIPHFYWKFAMGKRIENLVVNLNLPVLPADEKLKNRKLLCDYLLSCLKHHNNHLFLSYIFAELLNFFNVIGQMFLIDKFLGGHFMTYGIDVLKFSEWDSSLRYDPMIRVFPRMTKCLFHYYGPSGDIVKKDFFCLLPVNIINEKIYIFLWFWLIILAILSALVIVYRALYVLMVPVRLMALQSRCPITDRRHLKTVTSCCRLTDWMLLHFLAKNIDSVHFKEVIADLGTRLTLIDKDHNSSLA